MASPTSDRAADARLLAAQDADGAWRDYALEPGRSDAWVTAVVGRALATPPVAPGAAAALGRAADFLHAARRADGWGYNPHAAADADSTSWALALLVELDDLRAIDPVALLASRLDGAGGAHTFSGPRFGRWAGEHPEVTAVAAEVLLACGADAAPVLARVRATQRRDGGWPRYWWSSDAYATARSLAVLRAAGRLDDLVAHRARQWLARGPAAPTAFDLAHVLLATAALGCERSALERHADRLRARALPDGGWGPSATLLVPAQHADREGLPHPDDRGLMTTAVAVAALKAIRLPAAWSWATDWQASGW